MRYWNLGLISIVAIAYLSIFGFSGLLPFFVTPYMVTAWLALRWRAFWSQVVLLFTTIAHVGWFVYVYTASMHDAQGGIAMLIAGIYAAPVLFILWLISYAIEWESRLKDDPTAPNE